MSNLFRDYPLDRKYLFRCNLPKNLLVPYGTRRFLLLCRKTQIQHTNRVMRSDERCSPRDAPERVLRTMKRAKRSSRGQNLSSAPRVREENFGNRNGREAITRRSRVSRSRLPPRSVLLCVAQRCPPDTRTLP